MNTLDSKLQHDAVNACGAVSAGVNAWEARIWLDRREDACVFFPSKRLGLARFKDWFRGFAARTQMGPVGSGETWLDRHVDERF